MSASRGQELSDQLLRLCDRAHQRLLEPSVMSGWEVGCASGLRRLEVLREELKRAQRPLTILMLGGTGVGKSTLLNALAGE